MIPAKKLQRLVEYCNDNAIQCTLSPSPKYHTDASIFKKIPQGVVVVDDRSALQKIIRFAADYHYILCARAGGSNTGGAAITEHIVVDVSKITHIGKPIKIGDDDVFAPASATHYIAVGAGERLSAIQRHLASYNLQFPLTLTSEKIARVGGTIATKAGAPQTFRYGSINNWIRALHATDGEGVSFSFDKQDRSAHSQLAQEKLATLQQIKEACLQSRQIRAAIKRHRAIKHSAGLNLAAFTQSANERALLTQIMCGSMGTLAFFDEAQLYCQPREDNTLLVVVVFFSFLRLLQLIDTIRAYCQQYHAIHAIELLPIALGETSATILFEIHGLEAAHVAHGIYIFLLSRFGRHIQSCATITHRKTVDYFWNRRKTLLQKKYVASGNTTIALINDITIPPRRLYRAFLRMEKYLQRFQTPLLIYGHIADGNLHFRPIGIPKNIPVHAYGGWAYAIYHIALQSGGSVSGEHGSGMLRAPFIAQEWGVEAWQKMKEIKELFDPHGIFDRSALFSETSFADTLTQYGKD